MIKKEKKLVITFSMQDDVMAFNRFCKEHNIPGKVIHIPMTLTAGCGLSFETDLDKKNDIEKIFNDTKLFHEGIYEVEV